MLTVDSRIDRLSEIPLYERLSFTEQNTYESRERVTLDIRVPAIFLQETFPGPIPDPA